MAEDGTEYELSSNQSGPGHRTWTVDDVPNGTYTLAIDGYNISEGEKFGQNDTTSDFVVNDGGTIKEAYTSTEVNEGETYTLPYTFQSNLARPGYTLTGYTVEGTLHDTNGNPVTELSSFTGVYTPMSDVTLTAHWEVTSGDFRLRDRIDNFITADHSFALTDGENTYPLTSNSYTNQFRTWTVDDVPNGVYTLLVDGLAYLNEWNLETTNPNSSATIAEDGTVTIDLTFADNSSTTFVRFDLTMNEYEVGVEVRVLNNRRTSDVGIRVENEEGHRL